MNKKTISRILLMSTLTVSLGVLAVSCHVKSKTETESPTPPKDKNPTPPPPKEKPLTPDERIKKELNDEASKAKIDYLKKDEISPSAASNSMFIFSGFDDKKYKILLDGVKPIDQGGISVVSFKIIDLKDEKKQSDLKEINVSGFKKTSLTKEKLIEIFNNMEVDYKDKENTYPWNYIPLNFITKNLPPYIKIVVFNLKGINPMNSDVSVDVVIQDEFNSSIFVLQEKIISGFKSISKDYSNLTKILLGNENKFINLNDSHYKTLILYQHLVKPNAEIIINFDTNIVSIPNKNGDVVLSRKNEFEEIGELTPAFKVVYNELISEVTKLINKTLRSFGVDSIEELFKVLTLFDEDTKKELVILKEKFKIASLINAPINFSPEYAENLEKILNLWNFEMAYNPKTGMFAIKSGNETIDFNKPETFKNIFGFKDELKNEIISKIKEVLTKHDVDSDVIDLFLNDNSHTISFLIEKNEYKILTGFKIKQIPSFFEKPKNK